MTTKKHAYVIFTKYPEAGVVKTKLMEENGGQLSGQEAAELYRAMLLDTATTAAHALKNGCRKDNPADEFDFYVSTTPESKLNEVKTLFNEELSDIDINYIVDRGENFDEHFNDCFNQLFEKGYHSVVCTGGDMPALTPDLIERAFKWMTDLEATSDTGAMALAPCQAGGVSVVGATRSAGMDFTGVFYNTDGVPTLDALIDIARQREIPTALFEALSDVDFMEDLAHTISVINAMAYSAAFQPDIVVPQRTIAFVEKAGFASITPPNTNHDPRVTIDG